MKNVSLSICLLAMATLLSCGKKEEKTVETTETTTVVKDTVVKEAPKQDDGTSVKIDSSGVDVNTKKVDVEIKK